MVYSSQPFKIIPNPVGQPISVGEEGVPSPVGQGGAGTFDWLLNLLQGGGLYPPISVGTPGTGTGTIEEPTSPSTCPAGYALNNNNQCVLIPAGTGLGDITQVQVPTTSTKGGQAIIKIWFKNTHTTTLEYSVQTVISGLGINVTSPTLSVAGGQTAMIESTVNIPTNVPTAAYVGLVQLKASNSTNTFVLQDSETFSLGVDVVTGGGGSGTATIVPSASSVKQGQSISISCSGFAADEVVDFVAQVGSNVVATDAKTMSTAGSGTLSTLTFSTTSPLGTATITAKGRTSNRIALATVTVLTSTAPSPTVNPTITTNKTSYAKGEIVTISGTGYGAGEHVLIYITINSVQIPGSIEVVASSTGSYAANVFASVAGGGHAHAKGLTSNAHVEIGINVTTTPTSTATITLSKTSVVRGTSFSITCSGFGASEVIDFKATVGSTVVGTDAKTTGAGGSIILDTLYIIPTSPLGTATITAKGRNTLRIATKTITVVAPTTTVAVVTTNKGTYNKNETISVTGTGFYPGEKVHLDLSKDGGGRVFDAGDKTCDSTGRFTGTMPANTTGYCWVNAHGRTSLKFAHKKILVNTTTAFAFAYSGRRLGWE